MNLPIECKPFLSTLLCVPFPSFRRLIEKINIIKRSWHIVLDIAMLVYSLLDYFFGWTVAVIVSALFLSLEKFFNQQER